MSSDWLEARLAAYHKKYAGPKIRPLSRAVRLKAPGLAEVRDAIPQILAAQRVLLRHFLEKLGPDGTLEFLGVPPELSAWMAALSDPDLEPPILRVDVLPLAQGEARICEINIDSCVGVAEAADFLRIEEFREGRFSQQTPYEHLVALLGRVLAERGCDKVCLFDWSHWQESGWFTLERLHETLVAGLPGVEVFFATEQAGIERVDARTVVFRVFPSSDALAAPALTTELFSKAGHVMTDFSADLLSSKVWMAVFHDNVYRELLTDRMCAAIDSTIPWTVLVDGRNREALLAEKDRWFFKSATDFGGRGVLAGRGSSEAEIRERLSGPAQDRWVAQERCEVIPLDVRPLGASEAVPSVSVLGLYRFGQQWSGVLVRASVGTEVVNVSGGSFLGWGFEES
ncbi:hypothetical protein [Actinoplanes regularis]|uniref:hypothetical protein n=1 Tax=Actinoplanes regularis TaxID=52697 RepID=UPI0024A0CDBF|nr:hypothetical protein [Actinoplanes regularis]GLW33569.1 hypothetical protein Areg01_65070 [Actinoplanes regularis]